jgi:hypothetical protein
MLAVTLLGLDFEALEKARGAGEILEVTSDGKDDKQD